MSGREAPGSPRFRRADRGLHRLSSCGLRALRDAKDETASSRKLWKEMAELGWAGITLPEAYGGSGLGFAELGIVLEEAGRRIDKSDASQAVSWSQQLKTLTLPQEMGEKFKVLALQKNIAMEMPAMIRQGAYG